jgi:cation-transporting ATPase 13A1
MFASESIPGLNKYFQLVPFPDDDFRNFIIKLLAGDVILCFLFDRLMKFVFCREILIASVKGTTWKDVWHIARTVVVIGLLMNMFLGNSEQWEQMLAEEEARLAAEALNNSTIAEEIVDVVANVLDDFKTDEF